MALKRSSLHGFVFNDVNFEEGLKNRKSAMMKIPLPWLRAYKTIAVLLRFYCALAASAKFRIVTRSPSNGMSVLELLRFCMPNRLPNTKTNCEKVIDNVCVF